MMKIIKSSRNPLIVDETDTVKLELIIGDRDNGVKENIEIPVIDMKMKYLMLYKIVFLMRKDEERMFLSSYSKLKRIIPNLDIKMNRNDISVYVKVVEVVKNLPNIEIKEKSNEGNEKEVLLFLHGWPDDENVFKKQIDYFSSLGYRCLYYTLPWYGPKEVSIKTAKERNFVKNGYKQKELVDSIAFGTFHKLKQDQKVILIAHDWGAYHAQLFKIRHFHLVKSLVLIDVLFFKLAHFPSTKDIFHMVYMGLAYQYRQIFSFLLSQYPNFESFAERTANKAVKASMRLKKNFNKEEEGDNYKDSSVFQSFIYYEFQKDFWLRYFKIQTSETKFYPIGKNKLYDFTNDLYDNTFYIYGSEKPALLTFHTENELCALLKSETSCVTHLPSFHWIPEDYPNEINELILKYITEPKNTIKQFKSNL